MTATIRVGTRASLLATTQARHVADLVEARLGRPVELVEVTTEGDRSAAPLATMGGTGVFVTALRTALAAGVIDLAVHSYKDLPTAPAPGLAIGAVPTREDPRDVLVARDGLTLGELPEGSVIGTGSPRRAAQLLALGLGLVVEPIRGNVDTRLAAVAEGRVDAVVLAAAGLVALDRIGDLAEDHANASTLASGLRERGWEVPEPETNIVLATVPDPASTVAELAELGIAAVTVAGKVRFVTHRDVDAADISEALERLRSSGRLDALKDDLAQRKALDVLAESAKPISIEQAQARDKLWTPGSGEPAGAGQLWTPES